MDTVKNDADVESPSAREAGTLPNTKTDVSSRAASGTPTGIKSSPPVMDVHLHERIETADAASPVDANNDSEAETVVPNGHSPSKSRREGRVIKLEDKSNEGIPENITVDIEMQSDGVDSEGKEPLGGDGATSTLGKRKRTKNGHTANSSGLSSVPTSPVITVDQSSRSLSLPPATESDSEAFKSPTSQKGRKEKTRSVDKVVPKSEPDIVLDHEKEPKRFKRRLSSGAESSRQHIKPQGHSSRGDHHSRKRSRSTSPTSRNHRRSVSSSTTNGLTHKKKRVPPPLRATRDRASDDHSDSTSTGDSPHPGRSRTRNLVTPPTGDSNKMTRPKNAHHRTPLMNTCDKGNLEGAKQFLRDNPADLDAADPEGNTPLQCASLNGHADVVKMLLDAGCNIHTLNKEKDSPLLDAVENGHLEVVRLLLAAGVNPKQRNRAGCEPIDKLREDADDFEEIRDELSKARANWTGTYARPSLPVQSPHPENESTSARNRRTQSHGRSTKTGDSLLYTSFDVNSLRKAAGNGDLEMVVNILNVLGSNCHDVRSLIAAARGGHDEVLGLILGLTEMNPDPPPLKDVEWNHATPMLAAIGGDNIKVIELLLQNAQFDPTKVYNRMTYPQWAKEGKGPLWHEEERILQEAYDNYKKPSKSKSSTATTSPTRTHGHRQRIPDYSAKSNGSGSRDQVLNDSTQVRKRAASPSTNATPPKRGPGRPRKEPRENNDAQSHENTLSQREKPKPRRSDSDNTPTSPDAELSKPRRKKLMSGKERKEEQQSKHRRASFGSVGSTSSIFGDGVADDKGVKLQSGKNFKPHLSSSTKETETATGKSSIRPRKEGDAKGRIPAMREGIPSKRPRSSMTPPSSPKSSDGLLHKRRRFEGVSRKEGRHSSSPDRRTHQNEKKRSSQPPPDKNVESDNSTTLKPAKKPVSRQTPSPEEKRAAEEKVEAERKKAEVEAKRAKEEAARKAEEEAARLAEMAAKEEAERKKAEEVRLAALELQERERAERLAKEEAERQQRQREREAEIARREEEAKQRQLELERQRQEEKEQRQREIERQRELQLRKREEEKRRKEKEEKEARLAKLPALLRWFDRCPNPTTTDIASNFTNIQGVRYDTIRPEATGTPDGKEQWILNTQAALLLGEKDLQLSRYTAWEHIPVSLAAKTVLWGLENSRYAMLDASIAKYNPEFWLNELTGSITPPRSQGRVETLRKESRALFFSLDLTFVKLSDFMSVIHLHPHLRNVRMVVHYRELPPLDWTFEALVFPAKWKEDSDAKPDSHGNGPFVPGAKVYLNGNHIHTEEKAKYFQTSKSPVRERPEDRVPRRGLRQAFPHHADYRQLCIEQGLTHLLPDSGNSMQARGVTPPASNASTNDEPRRPSDTSSVTQAPQELSNGIHGTL